mmetsp:Transcript_43407/g.141362  ORF Transcript_43407/g.141362 Transcript_43407/m.141362 type:complete len:384 (-) Transcript_43407:218-1369(-)
MLLGGLEVVGAAVAVRALKSTDRGSRVAASLGAMASSLTSMLSAEQEEEDVADPSAVNLLVVVPPKLPQLMVPPSTDEDLLLRACGDGLLEQLSNAVPRRFGDTGGQWFLLHASQRDGTSLARLLRAASGAGPCVLLLRDTQGRVFGAFCSELREATARASSESAPSHSVYGTGETFLFALGRLALPPPPVARGNTPAQPRVTQMERSTSDLLAEGAAAAGEAADAAGGAEEGGGGVGSPARPPRVSVQVTPPIRRRAHATPVVFPFRWTRANEHFVATTQEGAAESLQLAIGAGGGLVLDSDISGGSSASSDTFDNPPLTLIATPAEGGADTAAATVAAPDEPSVRFVAEAVELWGVDEAACRSLPQCSGALPRGGDEEQPA